MNIIEFSINGHSCSLDAEKRELTGSSDDVLTRIRGAIKACQEEKVITDPHPTGGDVTITDPYGDPYQFALCMMEKKDDIGEFPDELGSWLFGMSNDGLDRFLEMGGVF